MDEGEKEQPCLKVNGMDIGDEDISSLEARKMIKTQLLMFCFGKC